MDADPVSSTARRVSAFSGSRLLASGPLVSVALAVKSETEQGPDRAVLVFDDATGAVVDLDLRGSAQDVLARLDDARPADAAAPEAPRRRGRPSLGVVPREVTLLPRHWDWLSAQPGGASQALRRLVDKARTEDGGRTARRTAREAAYRFMSAMAGDLPRFEEASRALFAGDEAGFRDATSAWPADIRDHVLRIERG